MTEEFQNVLLTILESRNELKNTFFYFLRDMKKVKNRDHLVSIFLKKHLENSQAGRSWITELVCYGRFLSTKVNHCM